jgi:hypothetical protein
MKKTLLASVAAAALALTTLSATAQMNGQPGDMKDPTVGGAAMYSSKTIVENAVNSAIHTTPVAAQNPHLFCRCWPPQREGHRGRHQGRRR